MRLKDVAMAERIKELSDTHAAASQEQQAQYDLLQTAKSEQEAKYEAAAQEASERHQATTKAQHG